ncbi:MAG: Por secretion system protein, partial [Muribaculaceae bacterium]|nr:Por secretion system protein [Muribaculaceae bacterium]
MKNVYSILLAVLACVFATPVRAQVVTTNPAVITSDTKGVEVTFHANWGNRQLMDLPAGQKVYAHTGLITSKSTAYNDWKYAPTWGDNSAKYELTKKSANEWVLNIPDIREYYGVTDPSEEILRLAFVFRNGEKTKEGKTVNWGDVFLTVFPSVFPACT